VMWTKIKFFHQLLEKTSGTKFPHNPLIIFEKENAYK